MWLLLFIIFVAVSCPSSYLSIKPFNQPSFFPSFFPSFLPFAFITPTGFLSIVLFTTFDTAIFRWCYSTLVFKGFLSINQWPGALSVQPKLSKIWKQRQMVQKLFRNCWISKMWNIQPKVKSWIKRKHVNIPREVVLLFGNFGKYCSIRYCQKVTENSNRTFWLNGKRPRQTGGTFRG